MRLYFNVSALHKNYSRQVTLPSVLAGYPWLLVCFDPNIYDFGCTIAINFPVTVEDFCK